MRPDRFGVGSTFAGEHGGQPLVRSELLGAAAKDGRSLLPALDGDLTFERGPIVHHSVGGRFAIRDGDGKYIDGPGSGSTGFAIGLKDPEVVVRGAKDGVDEPFSYQPHPPEATESALPAQLYHLGRDPREQRNLLPEEPAIASRLRSRLARLRETVGE